MGVRAPRPDQDRFAAFERRMDVAVGRWSPFVGLAIGLAMSPVLVRGEGPATWVPIIALSVALACWAGYFVVRLPARARRAGLGPVYVVGFLAMMAALVWYSPIFGFLAVAAYVAAFDFLPGRWRYLGLLVASAIVTYTYLGGRFGTYTTLTWVAYGVLLVVNSLVAGGYSWYGNFVTELSLARKEIIDELDVTNARLSETLDENAALHAQLLVKARDAGVLDERARMAREIHDTIAQGLTGIVTQLEAAESAGEPARRHRHVDTARALARESLSEARRSVAALAPGGLAEARLPDAISDMAGRWAETTGVTLTFDTTGDPRALLPDLEVALYRVAQEALANVGKHAGASRVGLTLSYMEDLVVLDVRDDGGGFDPAALTGPTAGSGFGLGAMEQRIRRVAGRWAVESAPGEGTAISVSVPAIPADVADGAGQ